MGPPRDRTHGVPDERRRVLNARPLRRRGMGARHVLYWMTATRRTRCSFALQRALGLAEELGLPLVVLEGLGAGYPDATARVAGEVLAGMVDNHAAFRAAGLAVTDLEEPHFDPSNPPAGFDASEHDAQRLHRSSFLPYSVAFGLAR